MGLGELHPLAPPLLVVVVQALPVEAVDLVPAQGARGTSSGASLHTAVVAQNVLNVEVAIRSRYHPQPRGDLGDQATLVPQALRAVVQDVQAIPLL